MVIKQYTKRIEMLEDKIYDLQRKLERANELNHHMWVLLREQTETTKLLQKITFGDENRIEVKVNGKIRNTN